jgi:hypothetical protein
MVRVLDSTPHREPWNKGKLVGQKAPLRLKDIWAIRVRLQLANKARELALFNLAIDSKLRSCDSGGPWIGSMIWSNLLCAWDSKLRRRPTAEPTITKVSTGSDSWRTA